MLAGADTADSHWATQSVCGMISLMIGRFTGLLLSA